MLAVLLLLAIGSRALVPIGFMPGHGGLIVCDGYLPPLGAETVTSAASMGDMDMSSDTGQPSTHGHASGHEGSMLCPFAAAAAAMAAPGLSAALVLIAHTVTPRIHFPPERFILHGTIVPTRLPRGPPATV